MTGSAGRFRQPTVLVTSGTSIATERREMIAKPSLSIVIPLFNEEQSIKPLYEAVCSALVERPAWEMLLVDDGSTDGTARLAAELSRADPRVRLVQLARNFGQTAAMQAGFDTARGEFVVSMDGDLQNDPADIPQLLAKLDEGYDLVAGYRVRRQDRLLTRKVPSWIANRLIRMITGVPIRDNGCSLKAYRGELLLRVYLYSDMHRFIPAMAVAQAGARVAEIPVRHHARRFGTSSYGLSRIWKVLADLLTIKMISSSREQPLLMFGVGAFAAVLAALFFLVLTTVSYPGGLGAEMVWAFVYPSVALVLLSLAYFLLLLGLIGEVVVQGRQDGPHLSLPVFEEWA